jgi:hypothetical protein
MLQAYRFACYQCIKFVLSCGNVFLQVLLLFRVFNTIFGFVESFAIFNEKNLTNIVVRDPSQAQDDSIQQCEAYEQRATKNEQQILRGILRKLRMTAYSIKTHY